MSCTFQGKINNPRWETAVRLESGGQSHGWRGVSHFLSCITVSDCFRANWPLTPPQPISFPGLDEWECAHFLCALKRLNTIAEVQTPTERCASHTRKPFFSSLADRLVRPCVTQASVNNVRVLVDAEYTYMNPALSLVTMAMMKKFNKDGAWIWNTYQCYLKVNIVILHPLEAAGVSVVVFVVVLFCFLLSPLLQESRALVLEALRLSQDEGFCLGVKLVRGAYMDKERKLAEKEGRQDPIHASWEDTNDRWMRRQWTNKSMSSWIHPPPRSLSLTHTLVLVFVKLQCFSQPDAGCHFPQS